MSMPSQHPLNLNRNQQGFASLVIALTMILVLALITVGFAQLTRREQQNALNKQLAIQANYAAETGINDAVDYLKNNPLAVFPSGCLPDVVPGQALSGYKRDINPATGVSYSCLMIDTAVKSLLFSPVLLQGEGAESFTAASALNTLTVEWDSASRTPRPGPTGSVFPAQVQAPSAPGNETWTYPAVLQFSITPLLGPTTRASLTGDTFTAYLYPTTGGGTVSYQSNILVPGAQGQIVGGLCNVVGSGSSCHVDITGLPVAATGYVIHFVNYYDTSTITISGKDAFNNPVKFVGAQTMIDSTGKARDVLKRLQVRVESKPSPGVTTQAGSICKRQLVLPNATNFSDFTGAGSGGPCDLLAP